MRYALALTTQWGTWIVASIVMFVITFSDSEQLLIASLLTSTLFVMLLSTVATASVQTQVVLADGSVGTVTARAFGVIGSDRTERQLVTKNPKEYQDWQHKHTIVYIGVAELLTDIGKDKRRYYKKNHRIEIYRARLFDVLQEIDKGNYQFLAYSQNVEFKKLELDKNGVWITPAYGMAWISADCMIIVGSNPDEVLNFKPNDKYDSWNKVFTFGQWQYKKNNMNGPVVFDEVMPLDAPQNDLATQDPYDEDVEAYLNHPQVQQREKKINSRYSKPASYRSNGYYSSREETEDDERVEFVK